MSNVKYTFSDDEKTAYEELSQNSAFFDFWEVSYGE